MPHSQGCPFYRRIFLTAFILIIRHITSLNLEVRRVSVLPHQAVCYIAVSWLVVGIAANVRSMVPMNASAKQQHENSSGNKETLRHC